MLCGKDLEDKSFLTEWSCVSCIKFFSVFGKVKVRVVPEHTMNAYQAVEAGGQPHTAATSPLVKEPLVPLGYEAKWATEPAWTLLEKGKNFLFPARSRTTILQMSSPSA
jgi:hypothetical protein